MNTVEFLERVRQTGVLPTVAEDWNDAAILAEATEALCTRFAEDIVNTQSGYWRQQTVQNTVIGQNEYRINPRAVVQGLQKFEVSRDGGKTWDLMKIVTLGSDGLYESPDRGSPQHYSHYSDYVRVYPTPADATTKFRFTFYLRPSKLILPPSPVGVVASANGTSIFVTGDITSWFSVPSTIDVVNTNGCNEAALFDVPVTSLTVLGGQTILAAPGVDLTRVQAGQVVRFADQTDQIPLARELHNGLAEYTAATILQNQGDAQQSDKIALKASGDIRRIIDLSIPRDKAHPQKIKPRNSYLRRNAGRRWR